MGVNGAGCSRPKDVVGSASDYLCRVVLRGTDILQSDREHPGAFEDVVATVSRSLHLNQQSLPSSTVGLSASNAFVDYSSRPLLSNIGQTENVRRIVARKDQRVLVNDLGLLELSAVERRDSWEQCSPNTACLYRATRTNRGVGYPVSPQIPHWVSHA